jgi:hypothetical protein
MARITSSFACRSPGRRMLDELLAEELSEVARSGARFSWFTGQRSSHIERIRGLVFLSPAMPGRKRHDLGLTGLAFGRRIGLQSRRPEGVQG